ncbi:MAG: hypothetical protein JO328_06080 [Hyphomicrobiales bacterium]|nr:hypothetical protein [Hyphomicrobiales bacterium]MBV8826944.1 hypothetical protein [Hyphomicrobiales bacterium]
MAYPQLRQKIEILEKKYGLDPSKIAGKINRDKTNAWRWLQRADRLKAGEQDQLVAAICSTLNKPGLTVNVFRDHNIVTFGRQAGLSKFETAIFSGYNLPVPDIFLDSLFDMTNDPGRYAGLYLVYRHDKEGDHDTFPYTQGGARIMKDDDQRVRYEDFWEGINDRQAYEGFVFSIGSLVNIVGQRSERSVRPEIWWSGLRVGRELSAGSSVLYGYVSDLRRSGALFTDRIVLVPTDQTEYARVQSEVEYYVDRDRIVQIAGRDMADYIDAWRDIPM